MITFFASSQKKLLSYYTNMAAVLIYLNLQLEGVDFDSGSATVAASRVERFLCDWCTEVKHKLVRECEE